MKKILGILVLSLLLSGCVGRYSLFMDSFSTGIIVQLIFFVLYFLPSIIALIRDIRNKMSVFFLNFFLGWTIIGFFVLVFYASLTNVTSNVSVAEFIKEKRRRR
jgi:hypothetical protein